MKKLIAIIMCVVFLSIGCGQGQIIDGRYCDTYGLLSLDEKCENVQYKKIVGNIIWGIILFETIVAPIYFFGFSLYEPVTG